MNREKWSLDIHSSKILALFELPCLVFNQHCFITIHKFVVRSVYNIFKSTSYNFFFRADHGLYTPGLDENCVIGDFVHAPETFTLGYKSFVHAPEAFTVGYKILYNAPHNISRCCTKSPMTQFSSRPGVYKAWSAWKKKVVVYWHDLYLSKSLYFCSCCENCTKLEVSDKSTSLVFFCAARNHMPAVWVRCWMIWQN